MTDVEANAPTFDAKRALRRGHVESYFLKINSPAGDRALWLKWTLFAPPRVPARCETWAVAFTRGAAPRVFKSSTVLSAEMLRRDPFALEFAGATFDGTHARGEILDASGGIRWNISLEPRLPTLRPLPYPWMYKTRVPESKLITPTPDASTRGEFVLDGVRTDATGWRGMQGHNWGTRHAHRYAWCHAAGFDHAGDAVFEAFSARLARAGHELPWVTLAFLWIDGGWLRFDAPRVAVTAASDASVMRWAFATRSATHALRGEVSAHPLETAGLHYANPQGEITYCLNSKLSRLTLTLDGPEGSRTLHSDQAAFELGWPTADHGIAMGA